MVQEQETDEDRFFMTFEAIVLSVVQEKQKDPKWAKKIKKFKAIVQFRIHTVSNENFILHMVAREGHVWLVRGPPVSPFDIEFAATPDDLFYFVNREYSIPSMILKKNQYGKTRLRFKKGGRNVLMLLFLANLLRVSKHPIK